MQDILIAFYIYSFRLSPEPSERRWRRQFLYQAGRHPAHFGPVRSKQQQQQQQQQQLGAKLNRLSGGHGSCQAAAAAAAAAAAVSESQQQGPLR